ncbi:hypothetical protein [Aliivibrio fischeri]|uniref:hypothetical protein n=1 Tax=Aliivibrio fischeri TaxID=668 RepID=UPI00080E8B4A|nr:hypothetical protein [Aliivibrio fischeri]OCH06586.1 hypothetical protein A6E11_17460 [Aliivibrio fischeri]
MQRFSLIFLLLIAGCSSNNNVEALNAWDKKYNECDVISKENNKPFPETEWFKSLSLEDKKEVVIYVFKLNDYNCARDEANALHDALIQNDNQSLLTFFNGLKYFEPVSDERIKHLDREQIDLIISEFNLPFKGSKVAEQLGFYN